jgi:hypothetical protein
MTQGSKFARALDEWTARLRATLIVCADVAAPTFI